PTPARVWIIESSDIQYTHNGDIWEPVQGSSRTYPALFWAPRVDVGYRIKQGEQPIDVLIQGDISANINDEIFVLPYYSIGVGIRVGL
ncbi:MAG: hypothetical protein AAFQ98_23370, partial [Bacteroidota bacterium]